MSRPRVLYVCQECGYRSPRWVGRCPGCGHWNTMAEERQPIEPARRRSFGETGQSGPVPLHAAGEPEQQRLSTGSPELDRVLGGGIVPGSLVLIGGDPGIGKSTLLLQVAAHVAAQGNFLYMSGEESAAQVAMRARRLGVDAPRLCLLPETDIRMMERVFDEVRPVAAVIDSIQTVYDPELSSAPGSVTQVRECAARFLKLAKTRGTAIFLVGHVTKGGDLAGPRTLEHAVDAVLYFEGDRHHVYRILRAVKNRFGATNEVGIFEMGPDGLREVPSPSEVLLAERPGQASGSVIVAGIEGTRPLLVEIQALLVASPFGHPRRTVSGLDANRVAFILAVLEKRGGLRVGSHDAYLKVSGGLRLSEPAADLGIAVAVASSFRDRPAAAGTVVFGEVGLSGEVRAVARVEPRLQEAARMGFQRCLLPAGNLRAAVRPPEGLEVIGVTTVAEAIEVMLA
ncbi:MAG TPA: DNA repair protein RadA [Bacillota bacterium]